MLALVECRGCGNEFSPHRRDQIACSQACSSRAFVRKNSEALNAARRTAARAAAGLSPDASETALRRAVQIKSEVSYGAAHDRVRRERGSASERSCVDCGDRAEEWSYTFVDPDERVQLIEDTRERANSQSRHLSYSLNPRYYEPRCKPCHLRFDSSRHAKARVG